MSKLTFVKYHGAGNDFILIDDRALFFQKAQVPSLCHRHFGIGADGVILLQNELRMRIYNSDGSEAASCGNGLRCLAAFLLHLGFERKKYKIATQSGAVEVDFIEDKIAVKMGQNFKCKAALHLGGREVYLLDTGVPHAVVFIDDLARVDFLKEALALRASANTNVNYASFQDGAFHVRTFERGVEGETLSCGTGAVAVAVAAVEKYALTGPIHTIFKGGTLEIQIRADGIWMIGPAQKVFEGTTGICKTTF